MAMTEDEIDRIGLGTSRNLLKAARKNQDQDVTLVMMVIIREGKPPSIVHQNLDYGDDDARSTMSNDVLRYNRYGLLANGERLELREVLLAGEEMLRRSE